MVVFSVVILQQFPKIVIHDVISGWARFAYLEICYNSLNRLFYPDHF